MSSSLTGVTNTDVVELVDTLVLGTSAEMREGSSPFIGTKEYIGLRGETQVSGRHSLWLCILYLLV